VIVPSTIATGRSRSRRFSPARTRARLSNAIARVACSTVERVLAFLDAVDLVVARAVACARSVRRP
jgi:hypothetical protein